MEIYATRDIETGEEIFLDYEVGWEKAWQEYAEQWSPPGETSKFASYKSVTEMNQKSAPLRTLTELETNPYPTNVITGCFYVHNAEDEYKYEEWQGNYNGYLKKYLNEIEGEDRLEQLGYIGDEYVWEEASVLPRFWPCDVIDRDDDGFLVQIYHLPVEQPTPIWAQKGLPLYLTSYPRQSIRFFDRPFLSDQYLPGAFRHSPELPDDIFPEQWKNLK